MKQLNVGLPDELHQAVKLKAVQEGRSVTRVITDFLETYVGQAVPTSLLKDTTIKVAAPSTPRPTPPPAPKRQAKTEPVRDFSKKAQAQGRMYRP